MGGCAYHVPGMGALRASGCAYHALMGAFEWAGVLTMCQAWVHYARAGVLTMRSWVHLSGRVCLPCARHGYI